MLIMRTTTTTREATWNRQKNYPLKLFLWHLSHLSQVFADAYEKLREIELLEVVRRGDVITSEPHAIYAINMYLEDAF